MIEYENYHKHTADSNVYTPDSVATYQDYFDRTIEVGGKTISTVEHGWCGNNFDIYLQVEKFNKKLKNQNKEPLKFVFGGEFYWVKDRHEKDNSNCHMVILARNENGRKKINGIMSQCNKDGFYFKPRLDIELIKSLPKNDVMITTACVAGWKYDNADEIFIELSKMFPYFFLEVQSHNTKEQKELNAKILKISKENNIPIIAGVDSHMISSKDSILRDDFLKSKKIFYDDEEGWTMDYPTGDELYQRFIVQGILSEEEIMTAINNTLIIRDFENIIYDKSIKVPIVFPNKTLEERNEIFKQLINKQWMKAREEVPKEQWDKYIEQIRYEVGEIIGCNMADYFLTTYETMKLGTEKYKGVLTRTGRGSGCSEYVNKLLEFTNVDRISARVTMYPERFMTKERILESHTPPDIDHNVADREPYKKAQEELLGSAYDLIAFGTLKFKSAWKMYARAYDIKPSDADIVSKQIDKYEDKLKHAERDETTGELLEEVNIHDFVEEKYWNLLEGCKKYLGIKDSRKGHPCFLGEELVMTSKGYKQIKDIVVGDYVLTHKNRFMEVKEVMVNKSNDIYELRGVGVFKTKATGNHPYYVRNSKNESPIWKNVSDIEKGDYVGIPINKESKLPISEYNLPFDNESFWWLIGRYLGDGWLEECERYKIRKSGKRYDYIERRLIICCSKDEEKNEKEEIIKHLENLKIDYRIEERRTVYRIYIKNKDFKMYVKQFGKYAYGKKLTNDIFDLPIQLLKALIEGYLSADGSYNSKKNEYSYKTVSKELALGISYCINKVYHKHCTFTYIKPRIDTIEGRIVNSKEKYEIRFSKEVKKQEHNFYENDYIWCKVKEINKTNLIEDTYNLSVIDDNSYTVNNIAVHNCGTLATNLNVEEEVGVILCKSETTKKEVLVACIESGNIDYFGWLKQDFLLVDVVRTTNAIYERLNMKPHTIKELLELTDGDKATWDIYAKGLTLCINQVEQPGSRAKTMEYKPQNEVELCALIAGIRPSFASLLKTLLKREEFNYGIPSLDNLIQTPEMPYTFILYQEQLMQILGFAGFPMKETYDIVKSVSKKKTYCRECGVTGNSSMKICPHCGSTKISPLVDKFKEQFAKGFAEKLKDAENKEQVSSEVWHIVEAFAGYGFNASHSYCMALDSLNQAYLKAHYPLAFYETMLRRYTEKGNKDKVKALKEEMKNFNIKLGDLKFGEDNRNFTMNEETNTISQSLVAIKGVSQTVANEIYELSKEKDKYNNFMEIVHDIKTKRKGIKKNQLTLLIEVGYFSEYGSISYLKKCLELYDLWYNKKVYNKVNNKMDDIVRKFAGKETKKQLGDLNNMGLIDYFLSKEFNFISTLEKALIEFRAFGDIEICDEEYSPTTCIAIDLDDKWKTRKITFYNICSGKTQEIKVGEGFYILQPIKVGDVVDIFHTFEKPKKVSFEEEVTDKDGNTIIKKRWRNSETEIEFWCDEYHLLNEEEIEELNREEYEYRKANK